MKITHFHDGKKESKGTAMKKIASLKNLQSTYKRVEDNRRYRHDLSASITLVLLTRVCT